MKQRFTMRAGALDGIETFLAVARHRNFRKAADELGVSPSAASQTVRALETRLGVPLFLRTTRSVGLTEAGERLLADAAPAFESLAAAAASAQGLGLRPSGRLRIAIARGAVPILLRPVITPFLAAYPEIALEIVIGESVTDIVSEGFDAAIRFGELVTPEMTAIRLTPGFRLVTVAAPAYLAGRGVPAEVADLARHQCLRFVGASRMITPWRFRGGDHEIEIEVSGPLIANDFATLRDAALDAIGIAQLPAPLCAPALRSGALVPVLETEAVRLPGMFLCHPGRRQTLPKLRAFIDHMSDFAARLLRPEA
jgi:DNA-binding transcriptional LysR family regulator